MSKLNQKKSCLTKLSNKRGPKSVAVLLVAIIIAATAFLIIVEASPDSVSDTFSNETKITKGTDRVNVATTTGQVTLAECYSPSSSWSYNTTTIVRNIASLSSTATTSKDIYCDNVNCILWTAGAAAPTTVCIAQDANVYGNILWEKGDSSASITWADSNFSISGGDVGGTHASGLKAGNGSTDISNKNWLERYYATTTGMFNAQDLCKAKGSGWRLPNLLELDSIRDQAKGSSPYSRLPGIVTSYYWSSSENPASNAYNLRFYNGNVYYTTKSNTAYVRCVRGQ